jgi:sulfur carrier protein
VKIHVNGEAREIQDQTTVRGLIELLDLAGGPVAVERNGEIVPRADHASTSLSEGDVLEIVHFVGGG